MKIDYFLYIYIYIYIYKKNIIDIISKFNSNQQRSFRNKSSLYKFWLGLWHRNGKHESHLHQNTLSVCKCKGPCYHVKNLGTTQSHPIISKKKHKIDEYTFESLPTFLFGISSKKSNGFDNLCVASTPVTNTITSGFSTFLKPFMNCFFRRIQKRVNTFPRVTMTIVIIISYPRAHAILFQQHSPICSPRDCLKHVLFIFYTS